MKKSAFFRLFASFFSVLFIFSLAGSFAVYGYYLPSDDIDYDLNQEFISSDYPLFIGSEASGNYNSKKNITPLPDSLSETEDNMLEARNFRIPSLLSVPKSVSASGTSGGTLIAAIDNMSGSGDWGRIGVSVRISEDNAASWQEMKNIISLATQEVPKNDEDWKSAFCIDPSMVQCSDGSVIMMVDMYPESKGLHENKWLDKLPSYVEIEDKSYLALYAGESAVGGNNIKKNDTAQAFTVREDGWVYTSSGEKTNYYLPQKHSAQFSYETMGDMYYARGEADYINTEPPMLPQKPEAGDSESDIYVGNIYLSFQKGEFNMDNPVFIEKKPSVSPSQEEESANNQIYTTSPAPLRCAVTSYVWMLRSFDSGKTWEQPSDITAQVKISGDGTFLGVCPGNGIILKKQSYSNLINRLVFPVYALGKASVIYSDDNGKTWSRPQTGYINNVDEVQCVESSDGVLIAFGRQDNLGKTPVSISYDGGTTWKKDKASELISVKCQKSVIALPFIGNSKTDDFVFPKQLDPTKQYVLSSHPTGNLGKDSSRSAGVVTLGVVNEDSSVNWLYEREIKIDEKYEAMGDYENFFAYSSLCLMENGNFGLLYEAFPSGYIVFTQFNLDWIIGGNAPVQPALSASLLSPLVLTILISVLLLVAGFTAFGVSRRKKRLDNNVDEFDFENYDNEEEYYEDSEYQEYVEQDYYDDGTIIYEPHEYYEDEPLEYKTEEADFYDYSQESSVTPESDDYVPELIIEEFEDASEEVSDSSEIYEDTGAGESELLYEYEYAAANYTQSENKQEAQIADASAGTLKGKKSGAKNKSQEKEKEAALENDIKSEFDKLRKNLNLGKYRADGEEVEADLDSVADDKAEEKSDEKVLEKSDQNNIEALTQLSDSPAMGDAAAAADSGAKKPAKKTAENAIPVSQKKSNAQKSKENAGNTQKKNSGGTNNTQKKNSSGSNSTQKKNNGKKK